MKVTAIIIDDESKLRDLLQIKIERNCPEISILGKAKDASEAEKLITVHKPQLIFLDIQMPGATGFDLLKRFDSIDFEIIFVTGYNDYALQALKVSAVDYVLKPIQTDDLVVAVNKAVQRIQTKEKVHRYEVLKHNLDNKEKENTKIVIPGAKFYQYVEVSSIIHCEGWQKYTKIHLSSGETILSSYNIGIFRDLLKTYTFFSPHKSHLINLHAIVKFLKEGTVIMSNNSQVPVSRRRKAEFLDILKKNKKSI